VESFKVLVKKDNINIYNKTKNIAYIINTNNITQNQPQGFGKALKGMSPTPLEARLRSKKGHCFALPKGLRDGDHWKGRPKEKKEKRLP
jgi:hypothetical protein